VKKRSDAIKAKTTAKHVTQSQDIPGIPGIPISEREFEAARKAVGRKGRDRFAWILSYAQRDPATMTLGERLDDQVKLLAFAHPFEDWQFWFQRALDMTKGDYAENEFSARPRLKKIIDAMNNRRSHRWKEELDFYVTTHDPPYIRVSDDTDSVLRKFVDLYAEFRTELRRCADEKCQHLFIGRPNKDYCSTSCLSRTTTQRSRSKKGK
jgi:hypothetical protein